MDYGTEFDKVYEVGIKMTAPDGEPIFWLG